MKIYFDEENMPGQWTQDTMKKAFELAGAEESLDPELEYCVSVSFVDMDEIHRLNREYRSVDNPTDVLSFPAFDAESLEDLEVDECGELALGDVVICDRKAREQAVEYGHSYERELIYLFVHSIFHLLGYDHEQEDDKKLMRSKEESVMTKLGITE